jgi:hypothetical protein
MCISGVPRQCQTRSTRFAATNLALNWRTDMGMTLVVKRFHKFKSCVNSAEGAERLLYPQTLLTAQNQRPVSFCRDTDVMRSQNYRKIAVSAYESQSTHIKSAAKRGTIGRLSVWHAREIAWKEQRWTVRNCCCVKVRWVSVTFHPPQILRGMVWDWTRASTMRDRRLTAWATAGPLKTKIYQSFI